MTQCNFFLYCLAFFIDFGVERIFISGTATIDPFRNDTTLRPYACSPGTYCLTGVGSTDVVPGDYGYAQLCTEGFYCEAGSNSPRGSGLCPPGTRCAMCKIGQSVV